MAPLIQLMKHEDGTVSYWFVELSTEEEKALYDAIEPFSNNGFSVRGGLDGIIDELKELLEEVPGWA